MCRIDWVGEETNSKKVRGQLQKSRGEGQETRRRRKAVQIEVGRLQRDFG